MQSLWPTTLRLFYAVMFLVLIFVTYVPEISATARAPRLPGDRTYRGHREIDANDPK
jgi:hypothetical protein